MGVVLRWLWVRWLLGLRRWGLWRRRACTTAIRGVLWSLWRSLMADSKGRQRFERENEVLRVVEDIQKASVQRAKGYIDTDEFRQKLVNTLAGTERQKAEILEVVALQFAGWTDRDIERYLECARGRIYKLKQSKAMLFSEIATDYMQAMVRRSAVARVNAMGRLGPLMGQAMKVYEDILDDEDVSPRDRLSAANKIMEFSKITGKESSKSLDDATHLRDRDMEDILGVIKEVDPDFTLDEGVEN